MHECMYKCEGYIRARYTRDIVIYAHTGCVSSLTLLLEILFIPLLVFTKIFFTK